MLGYSLTWHHSQPAHSQSHRALQQTLPQTMVPREQDQSRHHAGAGHWALWGRSCPPLPSARSPSSPPPSPKPSVHTVLTLQTRWPSTSPLAMLWSLAARFSFAASSLQGGSLQSTPGPLILSSISSLPTKLKVSLVPLRSTAQHLSWTLAPHAGQLPGGSGPTKATQCLDQWACLLLPLRSIVDALDQISPLQGLRTWHSTCSISHISISDPWSTLSQPRATSDSWRPTAVHTKTSPPLTKTPTEQPSARLPRAPRLWCSRPSPFQ